VVRSSAALRARPRRERPERTASVVPHRRLAPNNPHADLSSRACPARCCSRRQAAPGCLFPVQVAAAAIRTLWKGPADASR